MPNDSIYPDNTLFIRCTEGVNQGITGEPGSDVFVLRELAGTDLFRVTFTGNSDEGVDCVRVERLTHVEASEFPNVYGGVHLAYKLHDHLMEILAENEAEFFADCFQDEHGRDREYTITFQ